MAPPEKEESEDSGITGTLAVVGLVCGFIGAVVGAFGWSAWKKEEGHQQHGSSKTYNTGSCPICMSEMENLQILRCGHQYHEACIEQMKKSGVKLDCPLCRKHFGK
jgi:hypothetical protein